MPRPKKYHTVEQKKAADAARSRKSYEKRRDDVCTARRAAYAKKVEEAAEKQKTPRRVPLTEAERRKRHCDSSNQSYQRRKSEIQASRRITSSVIPAQRVNSILRGGLTAKAWLSRIWDLKTRVANTLDGYTPIRFAQDVLKQCIRDDEGTVTDKVHLQLRRIADDIVELQSNALNTFGYGSEVKETEALSFRVQEAVRYVDEIGMAPMLEVSYTDLMEQFQRRERDMARCAAQERSL